MCCDCGVKGGRQHFSKRQWNFPLHTNRRCMPCAKKFSEDTAKNGRVTRDGVVVNRPDIEEFDYCFESDDDTNFEDAAYEHSDCEYELDGLDV